MAQYTIKDKPGRPVSNIFAKARHEQGKDLADPCSNRRLTCGRCCRLYNKADASAVRSWRFQPACAICGDNVFYALKMVVRDPASAH
jgi:hypothetical protein